MGARRNAMRRNTTRHNTQARHFTYEEPVCCVRVALPLWTRKCYPGLTRGKRGLEPCATSKGLEPVLTCLACLWLCLSLSLHSPSLLIKKSSPAWFDRAYILIKRHDGGGG